MSRTVSRTISGTLRWTWVEISPETTAMPVLTRVSQATRPPGSSPMIASRTPSEIWSATLSGWPSVTDSEVKRYSPSARGLEVMAGKSKGMQTGEGGSVRVATAPRGGDEIDDQGHALELIGLAHPVLQVVGPVAADQLAVVDLDRHPRRAGADLGGVVEAQALAALGRRRRAGDDVAEEAVERGGRDPLGGLVGELERPWQQRGDVAAALRRAGDHRRPEARLALDAGAGVVDVGLADVPLVHRQQAGAAGLHRRFRHPQVLARHPLGGVADDDRRVGPLHRPFRAQLGVVVDGAGDLGAAAQAGGVDQDHSPAV